jgi:hypothetical protein
VSNKRILRFVVVLLFAAFSSAALVLADAATLVQNSNSGTTEEGTQNANMNANTSAPRRSRGRRRGRARTAPAAEPAAALTNEIEVMAPPTVQTAGAADDDDSRGDLSGEKVDLSGTYEGNLSTAGGANEMRNVKATLTITGNTFTLTMEGGANSSGRVYAVLTRGETSAAFYFTDMTVGSPATPLVYNVRARKRGDRLMLTPAPRTALRLTFR